MNPDGSQNVLQAVYAWNDSTNRFQLSYYREAGHFIYHPGHGHFHFDGYAYYRLRYRNGDGTPGDYVMRSDGTGVVGEKIGFCLLDFVSGGFTTEDGHASTSLPHYGAPGQPSNGCGLLQGVTVGNADGYSNSLQGQWIDVTNVPNGQYFLEISLDGDNAVLESNEANNAKTFAYTLNVNPPGGGITPDQFDTAPNHNDTFDTATDMGVMGTFTQLGLNIHWGQDFDYFKFVASSDGTYTVTATPANGDVNIYLYDASETQIGASTNPSGSESISYHFVAGQTYYLMANAYNSTTSSNYQIAFNLKPQVSNTVENPVGQELGAVPATFIIGRNGPTTSPLTVNFTLGGTAINGVDYQLVSNSVTIGDLASNATIQIVPISDGLIEGTETVTLTLNTSSAYVIGGAAAQQVTINDTPPQVQQVVQNWQTNPNTLSFAFSLDVGSSIDVNDFIVRNADNRELITPTGFAYDVDSRTATLTFDGVLPDAHYEATVVAAGVTHELGTPLPEDYVYQFFTLTADGNHDGQVNLLDFNILAGNFNQTNRDASQGDYNYDGIVNLLDFNLLSARFNTTLAAPVPLQPSNGGSVSALGRPATSGSIASGLFNDGKGINDRLINQLV